MNPAIKYHNVVIVRLDRTIQNLLKYLDSPVRPWNDGNNEKQKNYDMHEDSCVCPAKKWHTKKQSSSDLPAAVFACRLVFCLTIDRTG